MAATEAIDSGVSFGLTEEQRALQGLAREFALREIRPKAAEYDEHQTHPADVIAKAHEVGLMNPHIPEELGGRGARLDGRRADRRGALLGLLGDRAPRSWPTSSGRCRCSLAGTDEQKRRWLAPLLEEPILCSFALTEPGAGSDVSGDPDDRGAPRRRLRPQRLEDVHHERGPRGVVHGLRLDRQGGGPPRADGVRRPGDARRRDDREAPGQDGPARDRHFGDRASQDVKVPADEPARRGGRGLQDRDADARSHTAGNGRRRGRVSPAPRSSTRSSTRASVCSSASRSR